MIGYVADGYRRITKPCAKKFHKEGITVYMVPKHLRPGGEWGYTGLILPDDDFEKVVRDYTIYNCSYKSGHYCAFYVKMEDNI